MELKQVWLQSHTQDPIVQSFSKYQQIFWFNPHKKILQEGLSQVGLTLQDINDARNRLERFAPYLCKVFPQTQARNGIIQSEVMPIFKAQEYLTKISNIKIQGKMYMKLDNYLPISGSVKARGGIYTVLKHAQYLAQSKGMINRLQNYEVFASPEFREFFQQYQISVGSTGNLGLSIGIMGAKLGFKVTVHMSADAKEWKKQKLRSLGVHVVQYQSDFTAAVENGRKQASKNEKMLFIDDENSKDLFLGYSIAGLRLKKQLEDKGINISKEQPLFVYLPCGIGGGPGGITFGLKNTFGENVYCIFVQPTHSPCFVLGVYSGLHDRISVRDIGLDNKTAADGLAVGRPSGFVGKAMQNLIDAYYTVDDGNMFDYLKIIHEIEGIKVQPSASVGLIGPVKAAQNQKYLEYLGITKQCLRNSIHLVWATGGNMVPESEMEKYLSVSKLQIK